MWHHVKCFISIEKHTALTLSRKIGAKEGFWSSKAQYMFYKFMLQFIFPVFHVPLVIFAVKIVLKHIHEVGIRGMHYQT